MLRSPRFFMKGRARSYCRLIRCFFSLRAQIISLSARHSIPTIAAWREFAVDGGLTSYGTNLADAERQVGVYTGRILNGKSPSELPVQQATRVEFVLNAKVAKALGLKVPLNLLGRADEVIE